MKLSEYQQIFTTNVALLILKAKELGIGLTFGDAFRPKSRQKWLVQTGKSKTMNSMHLKRLAVDFNFFIDGKLTYEKPKLQELGDYWESLHVANRWGGNWTTFVDTPHFEFNPKYLAA